MKNFLLDLCILLLSFVVNKSRKYLHPSPKLFIVFANRQWDYKTYMVEQVEYLGQNDSTLPGIDDVVIEGAGL